MNSSKLAFEAHNESHRSHHIGWLRAAVLGANDGIISTSSLIVGITAANSAHSNILIAGTAGRAALSGPGNVEPEQTSLPVEHRFDVGRLD